MGCTLYSEVGPPPYQDAYNKCHQGLDPGPECACLEDQIQSTLGYPGTPQANWNGGCYLYYDYNITDVCPAYENGSSFNYTSECSSLCSLQFPNPCSPYAGPHSIGVGNFSNDRDQLSDQIEQKAYSTYTSDIQPLENKYVPDLCLVALEAECVLLNTTTPCIVKGCCPPWIIEETPGSKTFPSDSSLKCLSCQYKQTLPKTDFKRVKDPEWIAPSPPCSPPPPPPPPPDAVELIVIESV